MASYPPPPPGTPGGVPPSQHYGPGYPAGYAPGSAYDRRTWKAQRRAAKIQARWMREQYRMQRRYLRRGSIVGPLVLLALGIIFFLEQTGRLSWTYSLEWYARWWPAVLIVAGLILLLEWLLDQQQAQHYADQTGRPTATTHVLTGGAVFLLILLAFVGLSARWTDTIGWHDHTWLGHNFGGLDRVFGEAHESDDSLTQSLPSGGMLVVHDPWGAVTITGSSNDNQVHVSIHKQVYAWGDDEATKRAQQLQPTFSIQGNNLMLDVPSVEQGQADLTIEMPHAANLSVSSDHGDVQVSELHGNLTIASRKGDVDVTGIDGAVLAQVNNDDSSVSAKSVTGAFTLQGRAGDISLDNIDGPVMLQGDFFGTTEAQQINGPLRFETSRTKFSTARIDGNVEIENGDLNGERLLGPVTLATRNRTIELDDVSGPITVSNRNGAVSVTTASPLGPVNLTNQHGSVDLGLPEHAGFVLNAQTRNGELENDFGLQSQSQDESHWLTGTVDRGGPQVRIETSDGDVTVRKSVAAPLPPTPPAPPKLTITPQSPAAPAAPQAREAKPGHQRPATKTAEPAAAAPPSA
ncbi:MAG TPA: DUF4097 family beta strand repeat-containing protein [Candidatus Aquilonibacter sp.]|nr:DUF4097 family beta strand repeat-containing protein [Candidatus Aquilonibacter sp.]